MTDPTARALGRKIAFYRSQRGLSQRDFGAMIGRSETWVSQVERGVRRIDRMTVLRTVADALNVALSELAADTPVVAAVNQAPEPAVALRLLLSSSLALALKTGGQSQANIAPITAEEVEQAWDLAHAAEYDQLVPLLTDLVPRGEAATRTTRGAAQRAAFRVLARIYHACAAALSKLGEADSAWIAADRAIAAGERAGDQLLMGEGAFRLVLVFQADRRHQQAEQTAKTAIAALVPLVEAGDKAATSLTGVLHLQLAVSAARLNNHDTAYSYLDTARQLAEGLGEDRNDYHTEFGPTNVRLHEVGIAVELGDAGNALRAAAAVQADKLSPERHARHLIDVARAHLQRRNAAAVITALVEAERLTPEQVHKHAQVKNMLADLIRAGQTTDPRFRGLASRCGIRVR